MVIGTGGTNAGGVFSITVSPPLVAGQKIFARDVCHIPPLAGPEVVVTLPTTAPVLSTGMLLVLAVSLTLIGLLALTRTRWVN
jgi:hypothetical protein